MNSSEWFKYTQLEVIWESQIPNAHTSTIHKTHLLVSHLFENDSTDFMDLPIKGMVMCQAVQVPSVIEWWHLKSIWIVVNMNEFIQVRQKVIVES